MKEFYSHNGHFYGIFSTFTFYLNSRSKYCSEKSMKKNSSVVSASNTEGHLLINEVYKEKL